MIVNLVFGDHREEAVDLEKLPAERTLFARGGRAYYVTRVETHLVKTLPTGTCLVHVVELARA